MLILVRENDVVEKKKRRNRNNGGGEEEGEKKKKMYRGGGGGGGGLKAAHVGFVQEAERKRINEALDKHLERSSPSTSATTTTTLTGRALNGKDHHRSSMFKTNSELNFKDAKASGGLSLLSYYNVLLLLVNFVVFSVSVY